MNTSDAIEDKAESLDLDEEIEDEPEEDESTPVISSIHSYGADYTVDGLVRRLRAGSFYIPEFQRGDVWSPVQKSRFIESLLLDLPVPGIFVAKMSDARHIIIDGQQRLLTLRQFHDGKFPNDTKFTLRKVAKRWEGSAFEDLSDEDVRHLEDSIIHTTVLKFQNPRETKFRYEIFKRLNTGGISLQPQEIRWAVNHGSNLNKLLEKANADENWRKIYKKPHKRMKDQELILRFWALYLEHEDYEEPMKKFLDDFCENHSSLQGEESEKLSYSFSKAIETVNLALGKDAFRPIRAINAAVFDSIMVGLAKRLECKKSIDLGKFKTAYLNLLKNKAYEEAYKTRTSRTEKVHDRINASIKAFKNIP